MQYISRTTEFQTPDMYVFVKVSSPLVMHVTEA